MMKKRITITTIIKITMIRLRMTEMADEESLPVQCRVPFASRLLPIMGIDPGLSFNAVINFISVTLISLPISHTMLANYTIE